MNFELTSEQKEIRELALQFSKQEIRPKAQEYDEQEIFPKDLMKKAFEMGLLNTCIPEKWGGNGISAFESVLISEALAYGCMGINTSLMANDLALLPIVIGGNDQQKEKYLTPFAKDFKIASFCLTEPSNGSDAAGIKTLLTPAKNSKEWLLTGQKMWITNAGHADLFVVYGTTDPNLRHKGITAVIIDPKSDGVEIGKKEEKMGHRSSDTRAVSFNNVLIKEEDIIGGLNNGWKLAMNTLNHSRPLVAASALGGAQAAMDHAIRYSKERVQFGKSISNHQMIQLMLANMGLKVEAARLLTYKAAWALSNNQDNVLYASMAKAYSSDICMEVSTDAVQIFGGYGYSKEYPVEKIMRDAKLLQIYEGTSQIQRIVIAKQLLDD